MTETLFDRQFQLLEKELELVDAAIRQLDDITKGIKNWTIVTWTAGVGIALATPNLKPFLWMTAGIPIVFWLVEASYRRVQRTFIARNQEIRDFVNSKEFQEAAGNDTPFSFPLLIMRSKDTGVRTGIIGVMLFRTVWLLYLGLAALSIVVWQVPS